MTRRRALRAAPRKRTFSFLLSSGGRSRTCAPSRAPVSKTGLAYRQRTLRIVAASGRGGSRTLKALRRLFSKQLPSPIGLPLQNPAAPAGLEPATFPLTAGRTTIVLQSNRSNKVGGTRTRELRFPKPAEHPYPSTFQRAPSGNRTRTSCLASRRAAITPSAQLMAVFLLASRCKHRAGVEPAPPPYESGAPAPRRPMPTKSPLGSEGLEPSPARVRTGCAAANTSIPFDPNLHFADGAGGIRTHAKRIKSPPCCRYTTAPFREAFAFPPMTHEPLLLLQRRPTTRGGIEPPSPP